MSESSVTMPPNAICFMVMPFGVKATRIPDRSAPATIDFDALWYLAFEPAIQSLGYKPARADQDFGASIIHEMLERLALADLTIADLTITNANVYYEVGVRHAARPQGCVLISADWARPQFDIAQLRRITYPLPTGQLSEAAAGQIRDRLVTDIPKLANSRSPVFDLPGYPQVDHTRTTTFTEFVDRLTEFQTGIRVIRRAPPEKRDLLTTELLERCSAGATAVPPAVALELLRLVRDCSSWEATLKYVEGLPERLREIPSVQEEYWLARARIGNPLEAIGHFEQLVERYGDSPHRQALLAGRYRDLFYQTSDARSRKKFLNKAIEHYERGLFLDLNEHCASVSLPTLLRERGQPEDLKRADAINYLVELACERAEKLNLHDEWLNLTLLLIAFQTGDPVKALQAQQRIEADDVVNWELRSTLDHAEKCLDRVESEDDRHALAKTLQALRDLL